ncbi:MAG: hypothetical protein ACYCS7_06200, partial [Acidimicrobiales bacterium]
TGSERVWGGPELTSCEEEGVAAMATAGAVVGVPAVAPDAPADTLVAGGLAEAGLGTPSGPMVAAMTIRAAETAMRGDTPAILGR